MLAFPAFLRLPCLLLAVLAHAASARTPVTELTTDKVADYQEALAFGDETLPQLLVLYTSPKDAAATAAATALLERVNNVVGGPETVCVRVDCALGAEEDACRAMVEAASGGPVTPSRLPAFQLLDDTGASVNLGYEWPVSYRDVLTFALSLVHADGLVTFDEVDEMVNNVADMRASSVGVVVGVFLPSDEEDEARLDDLYTAFIEATAVVGAAVHSVLVVHEDQVAALGLDDGQPTPLIVHLAATGSRRMAADMQPADVFAFLREVASLPQLLEDNSLTSLKVQGYTGLVLFTSGAHEQAAVQVDALNRVARERPNTVTSFFVNGTHPASLGFAKSFGVSTDTLPVALLLDFSNAEDEVQIFLLEDAIENDRVVAWIDLFLEGKLTPYEIDDAQLAAAVEEKQPPAEDDAEGPLAAVTRDTFDAAVYRQDKDVVVYFYLPGCPHCQQFEPILHAFAAGLADAPTVDIVRYNMQANQGPPEDLASSIPGAPTVMLFPASSSRESLRFAGERKQAALEQWLHRHAALDIVLPKEDVETMEELTEEFRSKVQDVAAKLASVKEDL